ncbi:MAG: nucleotidyltransferase domain-containing protein [Nitrososphaeria archaeon]
MIEESVKETILKKVFEEYGGENVVAVCVYGSHVAGYARPDSDYDVIAVLKRYTAKIGYKYVREPLLCSILAVEKGILYDDARKSWLGEFVAGRFLNVYEPLLGKEFLEEVEIEYKKRVILEILSEFNGRFQPLMDLIKFPLEYFLFEKLRRRMQFYPPAAYSYTKTYGGTVRDKNIEYSLNGFRRAAYELSRENSCIVLEDNLLWVSDPKSFNRMGKVKAIVEETKRDITSYATHVYCGRVGVSIILEELKSKIERHGKIEPLEDLKHPSAYLNVPEGKLIVNEKNWVERIAEYLGLEKDYSYRIEKIGGYGIDKLVNVARKYVFTSGERVCEVVVKRFKDPRNIKWAVLALATLADIRFEVLPLKRMANEYRMILEFRRLGFNVPKVHAVDLDRIQLITGYIVGENVGKLLKDGELEHLVKVGEEIGKLHSMGYVLGDAKPDNMIVSGDRIYFTDLEQAKVDGDRVWDIIEFLNYSVAFSFDTENAWKIANLFSKGYLKYGGVEDLKRVKDTKYRLIFKPLIPSQVSKSIISGVDDATGDASA